MKEQLIKNGKFYNPATATLIAITTWWMHYEEQRRKIYQTPSGTFFEVKEVSKDFKDRPSSEKGMRGSESNKKLGSFNDLAVKEVFVTKELSETDVRGIYEHTARNNEYGGHHYTFKYKFEMAYEELFKVVEA